MPFRLGDARSFTVDEPQDAVFSNAVLHWIPEAEQVVRGIARVLKPGGRFVAEFGGKGNIQTLVKAFHRAFAGLGMSEPEDVSPWFYPGIAEYAALLEKHGLEVRSAALFERPTKLEDGRKGLENWIRVFRQTFVEKMGEEAAARWIHEVERQCRTELFKDGDWVLDYRRLRITAYKSGAQRAGAQGPVVRYCRSNGCSSFYLRKATPRCCGCGGNACEPSSHDLRQREALLM